MRCADCNRGPLIAEAMWPEYKGFARPKSQRSNGSGSSLIDRQPTGRAICGGCALRRQNGIALNQDRLDV